MSGPLSAEAEARSIEALANMHKSPFKTPPEKARESAEAVPPSPQQKTPTPKRRRNRSKNAHVMTIFDRDINLAAVNEDTTLYSACRAWMSIDTSGDVLRSTRASSDDGRALALPPPVKIPAAKRYKLAEPPGAEEAAEAAARVDAALETNPESIHAEPYHMMNAYTDTVKQYKLPLLMAWREKRQRDAKAWLASNMERYARSISVIRSNQENKAQ